MRERVFIGMERSVRRAGVSLLRVLLFTAIMILSAMAQQRTNAFNSILGITITSTPEQIQSKLGPLGRVERRSLRDGGSKQSWSLAATRFSHIAIRSDREGRVMWLTAFVREGEEIPFAELGDVTEAESVSQKRASWQLRATNGVGYRLVASGRDGKARAVSLFSSEIRNED